jgi:serine/threonine-protein kinase
MDAARPSGPELSRNAQRWARVEGLFRAALEVDPELRDAFIDGSIQGDPALAAELRALLVAYERAGDDDFLAPLDLDQAAGLLDPDESALRPGDETGGYVIARELGSGGMGVVYLAERTDPELRQRVALKILRQDMATAPLRRRFLRERRILARLQHPNIASLLDGGMTGDGRPFLAMEYVEGEPITQYCDRHRLSVDDRIRLFMDACAAVQYAHQSLVVHRDLKPGNILVSADERVKLLDFGIAKLLDPDTDEGVVTTTAAGQRALTPEYAAPEQVSGEQVTTATDVYSLGVVLYELLSGRRPHRFEARTLEVVARVLREQEPAPPSAAVPGTSGDIAAARGTTPERLRHRLAGDLDAIALTALRREPGQRYISAVALRDDLRRHLAGLPVSARRYTWLYRAARFVRRNRATVAVGALALLSLAGGFTAVALQERETARQRDLALREADKAASVSAFITGLFQLADPAQVRGEQVTVRESLDSARAWIGRELVDRPELRVEMAHQLGEIYFRLGHYEEARRLWESAVRAGVAHYGENSETVLYTMLSLVKALENLDHGDSAESLARRSLLVFRGLPTLRDRDWAATNVLQRLANTLRLRGRHGDAEALITEALGTLPPGHEGAPHRRTVLLTTLAHVRRARGDPAGAEAIHREVLATRQGVWGTEHPEVANALVNLAGALMDQRRYGEARMHFETGLAIRRKLQGETHPDYALDLGGLAELLRRSGRIDSATHLYSRALELQRAAFPPGHFRLVTTMFGLGELLIEQSRFAEAEPLLRESVETGVIVLGARHSRVGEARSSLGLTLARLGRHTEAEPHLVLGHEILAATLGADAAPTRRALQRLEQFRRQRAPRGRGGTGGSPR